jgi:hypothetical protein
MKRDASPDVASSLAFRNPSLCTRSIAVTARSNRSTATAARSAWIGIRAAFVLGFIMSAGCILGRDGRPLGDGSMNPLMAGGCAEEPGCGASCCSEVGGPPCSEGSGYCENCPGSCRGGNYSVCAYACAPCYAVGHCVGSVFNFCLPPACITGPPPLPPGRFFPVPTRPAFCPRGTSDGPPGCAM